MRYLLLVSTCAAAFPAAPTMAKDAPATVEAPALQDASVTQSGLEDIIVTAQRRSENLQRAAIPVSAVSGDALAAAGVTRPTELTSIIPALQVVPAAGPYNLFYIRGVGNFNGNALSDSALAFNVDGVYVGRPSASTGFFYDLERVEVVKGPQGTLYGRNATGGAINVITKRPELGSFGGSASVEYGNYDALRLDAAINAPLGDSAAIRIAGIRVRHDGYMNDGSDDQNDWGLRGSLRLLPTDTLTLDVVADYFDQRGKGPGASPILAPLGVTSPNALQPSDRVGFFSPAGQAVYTSQAAGTLGRNFYPFPADYEQFQRNHAWGVSATIGWDSPIGAVTIIPAHRENHLDYRSYSPGFQVQEAGATKQDSIEARIATDDTRPLRAIVGAFYFKENTHVPREAYASNWNAQFDTDLRQRTESEALFGRLVYAPVPEIRLNVGGRYTWEDKRFSGQRVSLTRVCFVPAIAGGCPTAPPLPFGTTAPALGAFPSVLVPDFGPAPYGGFPDVIGNSSLAQFATVTNSNANASFKKFTWRVGADWDITPENLLYASFETGFKSGGFFFSPDPARSSYQPETISAFTLGSKNRFLDNRLQLNVELFYWRYRDQQISHLVTIRGVPTFATENVGRATLKGIEIEARFAPTPSTMLSIDGQYLDAKYNRFEFLQSNSSNATSTTAFNGTGCPTTGFANPGNQFVVDCSGNRPPFSPRWTINLGGQQKFPLSFGEIVADARAHYQSSSTVGLDFLPVERQSAYWLVDAALTFNAPDDRFFVSGFINNIFDETIKSQMFPTPSTGIFATTIRPPRTYGLRAGVKF